MELGGMISLAGLIVSTFGLLYAIKAEKAAARAERAAQTATNAAEAAKAEARWQNLADELQGAQARAEQVGQYIAQQKWEIVLLRAQEVVSACTQVLRRWGADELSEQARDSLLRAQGLVASIARVAVGAQATPPTMPEVKRIASAQQRAFQLIAAEVATSRGKLERG